MEYLLRLMVAMFAFPWIGDLFMGLLGGVA